MGFSLGVAQRKGKEEDPSGKCFDRSAGVKWVDERDPE